MLWNGDDDPQFHLIADTEDMDTDSGRGRSLTTDGADTLRSGYCQLCWSLGLNKS